MRKLMLFIFSLLFASQVTALQIDATDNGTVTAKISSSDVTRILVKGDRIKSVRGVKGTYTRENDENKGEIYIQPTVSYQNRAFTVLLETEQGRHFTLFLNPMSIPADVLMLVPKGISHQQAERFEQASDYESTLIRLVRALSDGVVPDGYDVKKMESPKKYTLGKDAKLKLDTVYEGLKFQGEVYELTNTAAYPLTLNEKQFYSPTTRAISLTSLTILPHGTTHIIRVVSHA